MSQRARTKERGAARARNANDPQTQETKIRQQRARRARQKRVRERVKTNERQAKRAPQAAGSPVTVQTVHFKSSQLSVLATVSHRGYAG